MKTTYVTYGWLSSMIALLCLALLNPLGAQDRPQTPVERWGQLKVSSARLSMQDGTPVQLQGMSLFDAVSYGDYANADSLKWMRDDWKSSVFRAAMYTELNGQFFGESAYAAEYKVIQAAIDAGLYVLVDWHILSDGNPLKYKEQAKAFFTQVASRYGKYPNLIYEICNEPNGNGVDWENSITPYAMEVIPAIRAIDPDGVILVGTPNWSQQPHIAALSPLPFDNLMYVLHYYAGSHDQAQYLSFIDQAMQAGAGVFVTEWGATTAQVAPGLFFERSISWINNLNLRGISWCNWSLSTKLEATSALKPLANLSGEWRSGELTESGLLMRGLMRKEAQGVVFADGFDSGNFKSGLWIRDQVMVDKTLSKAGTTSIRFESKAALTKKIQAESNSQQSLAFWYKTKQVAPKDSFWIEYSFDGSDWKTLATLTDRQASQEWKLFSVSLPENASNRSLVHIRLRSEFKNPKAQFWLDEFELNATRAAIQ